MSSSELTKNRKAYHDYEILDKIEAGIVLVGTEIKSLRDHGGTLQDAYVTIKQGDAYLINCSIAPYKFGNIHNHEERRERKLLLHKREILKLKQQVDQKGITLIPLSLYLKKGRVKVLVGVAKGKKLFDKRSNLKEKQANRDIERRLKGNTE